MELDQTIAGVPVLRRLGEGASAVLWLGAGDRVLKVLRAGVDPHRLAHEAEALSRAAWEHVIELLDVSSGDGTAVLVLPRLPRGSLTDVLATRSVLDAGEAVTILVPVARALVRMHAAGVAHGGLSTDDVVFRADGAPVLCGLGGALLFEAGLPEVRLEAEPGVLADRLALRDLAGQVLARVGGSPRSGAPGLAAVLDTSDAADLEERLVRGLFALAAAAPVSFVPDAGSGAETGVVPGRAVGAASAGPIAEGADPVRSAALDLAVVLHEGPRSVARLVRARLTDAWARVPASRRRPLLAAGAGVIAVLVLAMVLPGASDGGAAPAGPVAAAPPAAVDEPSKPEAIADDDLATEDPVAALGELLARREDCVRELSVLCLTGVTEAGSSAERADRAVIEKLRAGGDAPPPLSAEGAAVVEQLGGSALVALGPDAEPASVLLMRTEAGWRIRDYLAAG